MHKLGDDWILTFGEMYHKGFKGSSIGFYMHNNGVYHTGDPNTVEYCINKLEYLKKMYPLNEK